MSGESKSSGRDVPTITLRSGTKMPVIGLGTWKAEKGVVAKIVKEALLNGYTHIDSACDYGNEEEVGQGIRDAIATGKIKRSDIFVTSKLWNTFHAKEHVRPACERSLKDMGLDYLDLYLIHFPISLKYVDFKTRYPPEWTHDPKAANPGLVFEDSPIHETWAAMEALVEAGLVKNIGVSNFTNVLVMDLLRYAKILPAVNQVEIHPYLVQPKLVEYCQSKGIAVTAYSPFGALSYVNLFDYAKDVPSLLEHEKVRAIGKAHNKSPAQVLLRWSVQRNLVVIPKSTSLERLKENIDVFNFKLTEDEMKQISALDRRMRFNDPGRYFNYPIFD